MENVLLKAKAILTSPEVRSIGTAVTATAVGATVLVGLKAIVKAAKGVIASKVV